jgi:hypothetical protein
MKVLDPFSLQGSKSRLNLAPELTRKSVAMKTILLVRDIYREAFVNLGHFITKNYFKAFAWFSFAMFFVVLYAFVFRVVTGFPFD